MTQQGGESTVPLQDTFVLDWNFCTSFPSGPAKLEWGAGFPCSEVSGKLETEDQASTGVFRCSLSLLCSVHPRACNHRNTDQWTDEQTDRPTDRPRGTDQTLRLSAQKPLRLTPGESKDRRKTGIPNDPVRKLPCPIL